MAKKKPPFKTPIRVESNTSADLLVGADAELILESFSHTKEELAEIVNRVNAYDKLKDQFLRSLDAWEGEEDSVRREHSDLIKEMKALCKELK
jgi:hypothetical protein